MQQKKISILQIYFRSIFPSDLLLEHMIKTLKSLLSEKINVKNSDMGPTHDSLSNFILTLLIMEP